MTGIVHVAVGVVLNSEREVLIARRGSEAHLGGLWEFPGGKLEPGENAEQALKRELFEEVRLRAGLSTPLLVFHHDYGDRQVVLNVWLVREFTGEAVGREGQPLRWVALEDLDRYDFPPANAAIINALRTENF